MPKKTSVDVLKQQLRCYPENWPTRLKAETNRPSDLFAWKRIVKMMKIYPIEIERVDVKTGFVGNYQWDGKKILAGRGDNLLHDFAHFQCAHPDRRFLHDFGLGAGPDTFECPPRIVSDDEADFEEACASILGILWEITFKMPFEYTLSYHRWDLDRNADEQLQFLEKHKLVVDGEPTTALRVS